ncbi:MAG: pilus assembly protein PilM, partial [Elusimicrobia bacterium]|nr:pilus assembly protein PilM [Elusimicrobiota bacterium]
MAGLDAIKEKLKSIDLKGLQGKASFLFGPSELIGVDIGNYAVKIAHLVRDGKGLTLKAWGYAPIDAKTDASPEERRQQTVNRLRALLIEKGVQLKHAATAISGNAVIVRYVKFPQLTKDELRATLATEAEPFIPFDINDVHLGFHILGELVEEGQKKMETVLVA